MGKPVMADTNLENVDPDNQVAEFRASGDRAGLAVALLRVSDDLRERAAVSKPGTAGDVDAAIQAAREGTTIARELGDQVLLVRALTLLAKAYAAAGRYAEAVTTIRQRVAQYPTKDVANPPEDLGSFGWFHALMDLSEYLQQAGDLDEAIQAATEATAITREMSMAPTPFDTFSDVRQPLADAMDNLASRYAAARHYAEAVTATEEAVAIYRYQFSVGIEWTRGYAFASELTKLSKSLQQAGRLQEAISAAVEAVDIYRKLDDKPQLTLALENLTALESLSPSSRNP